VISNLSALVANELSGFTDRVKVKVRVLRYPDGELAVMHGPRLLAQYTADGQPLVEELKKAA